MPDLRKLLNELLRYVVLLPFTVLIVWAADFGARRYFGLGYSHLRYILVAVAATTALLYLFDKPPGRRAIMAAVVAYFLVVLGLLMLC